MMPTSVSIIKKLRQAGYEAYWAGGCVRDVLLGVKPKDYDIVTGATPDEIEKVLKKVLEKVVPIGKKYGVIIAVKNGHQFEIATFRSDAGYSDGRRPDAVTFTDAKEDALRRDFTINGMFYDPVRDKILDYVGGQKDLDAKLIRFIGDPHQRILEDHLRILRAIRFRNEFDFQYEPKTYTALHKHSRLVIEKVAKERIAAELNKIMMSPRAANAFEDMEDLGILEIILPEIQKLKGVAQPYEYHHEGDVWTHTMNALKSLSENAPLAVRWAVLLHDVGKPDTFELRERIRFDHHVEFSKAHAKKILGRLRYPRKFIEEVCWLVEHHMMMVPLTTMAEGRKLHWFLHPWFLNLMQVFKADAEGTTPSDLGLYEEIYALYRASTEKMPTAPKPVIEGEEVMKILKIKPGKKVGGILADIREKQLAGEIRNKSEALAYLKKIA
jgi:tRNA nucleotidyltransferase/poly(A) polymerase